MVKNILIVIFLFSFGFASIDSFSKEYNYFTNYEKAKISSLKTNKPLMLLLVTNTCPWCEKLKNQTLRKKVISEYVIKNFTPVILNRDKKEYPVEKFEAKVVPTIFFINPVDENIINTSFGYKSKKKFLTTLEKTILK